VLQALPQTRLRSSWQIGGQWDAPARAAGFLLRDHRRKVWTGRCDVLRGADRLEPRATVVARFNAPEAFFATTAPELSDEQLRAWRELPATGQVDGQTLYAGRMLVFTRSGRLPWVPVSTAEYADFTLRDLQRRIDETRAPLAVLTARTNASPAAREAEDEAQLQRLAAGLRQVDPAAAERLVSEMRAQLAQQRAAEDARQQARARRAEHVGRSADPDSLSTMHARVRAWRAGLTAQQLAAPARLGNNGLHPDGPALLNAPRLVKPDSDFAWDTDHPAQPQMLMLSLMGGEEFEQPMQRVLQTLDLAALQALVRPRGSAPGIRPGQVRGAETWLGVLRRPSRS
jgi:hypothetical protein